MSSMVTKYHQFQCAVCQYLKHLDGIPPLLFRVLLFFPFYEAGTRKFANFSSTSDWFASMGFPLPDVMTFLAASAETVGGIFILVGFATRWAAIPLMITMIVAALSVHWDNGWYAIAQSSDPEVAERLGMARSILQEHGHYDWLTAKGNFAILQNGIEFAATYFIMLASLFFTGGGRYFSVDYWLNKAFPANK
ncbi:HvfX family Cu-binding RiPP maturation protein [Kangiella shandongensis]|uniref:HvfX family Cu-binding RiPP maturation protein n=1 Tax=Kangiella shandongensis TaxID=2763258 RepID=UPI001CBADA2B|nr:DoxX family protein [Kangiella shandongensis]